jgi:hypothetical protein
MKKKKSLECPDKKFMAPKKLRWGVLLNSLLFSPHPYSPQRVIDSIPTVSLRKEM